MEQESAGCPFEDGATAENILGGADAALGAPHDLEDIRRAAEAFNAAFNELLNESVISRRQLHERAGRISELDEVLQQTSRALQAEVDRYGELERVTAEQRDALREELQESGAERARLQQEGERLQEAVNARDAELSAQAARLEQLNGELEELRRLERTTVEQADALRQELQETGAERTRLQEQGERLQEAVNARDTELSAQAARLEQLGGEFEGLSEASRAEREAHAREVAELGAQLEARTQECSTLDAQLGTLQARVAGLEQELHEVACARDEAVVALQSSSEACRELEAHAANLENLNNALHDSSVTEQNRSRMALQMRDAEIQALQRRLERSGQAQDDTNHVQEELQRLRVRLAAAEHELGVLDEVRSALRQAEQELAARSEQDTTVAFEHENRLRLQEEIDDLHRQVTDMDALRASLEATQAENNRLRSEQQVADGRPDGAHELQQQLEGLQAENAGLQQQLAVSEQALAEMLRLQSAVDTDGQDVPAGEGGLATVQSVDFPATVDALQAMLPAAGEGMSEPVPDAGEAREEAPDSAGPLPETADPGEGGAVPVRPVGQPVTLQPAVFGNEPEIVSGVLRDNRLKDLYQPISTLRGDTSGFYEVLVRVTGEDGNAIAPADFFAMAQRCGRSYDVDCQIIASAVKELARDQSGSVSLFIKLSNDTVASEDLGMRVLKLIKQYKVAPGRLVFEVTEKNLHMDLKNVSSLTRALHSIGCKIAVEHYTGSTQVQYLKQIHVDFLKIDASLVHEVGEDENKLARIKEIIDIARSLECRTIAEQVESPYSLTRLWSMGVDYAQGYFIQEPGAERGYDFDGKSGDGGKAISNF